MNWKEVGEQLHIPEQWLNNRGPSMFLIMCIQILVIIIPLGINLPYGEETVLQIILSLQKQYQRIDSQNMSITKRLLSNFDSCNLFVKLRSVATD